MDCGWRRENLLGLFWLWAAGGVFGTAAVAEGETREVVEDGAWAPCCSILASVAAVAAVLGVVAPVPRLADLPPTLA